MQSNQAATVVRQRMSVGSATTKAASSVHANGNSGLSRRKRRSVMNVSVLLGLSIAAFLLAMLAVFNRDAVRRGIVYLKTASRNMLDGKAKLPIVDSELGGKKMESDDWTDSVHEKNDVDQSQKESYDYFGMSSHEIEKPVSSNQTHAKGESPGQQQSVEFSHGQVIVTQDQVLTEMSAAEVKETIEKHAVVAFVKTYCPYCRATKELLDGKVSSGIISDLYIVELDKRGTFI